ncbi:hypothetical protein GCM10022215_31070 [Nocardioides fonticola]|uniref:Secreted protein n=1 Tax=Nocardioides fonticola TaxID=450363 RepID=A0ABP7XQJ1_9ACTN
MRSALRVVPLAVALALPAAGPVATADAEPSPADLAAPAVVETVVDAQGDVDSYLGRARRDDAPLRHSLDLRSVTFTSDRAADLLTVAVTRTGRRPELGRRLRASLMVVGFAPDQVAFELLADLRTGTTTVLPLDDAHDGDGTPDPVDCPAASTVAAGRLVTLTVPFSCLLGAESAVLGVSTLGEHRRRPRTHTRFYSDDASPTREFPLTHLDVGAV